MFHRRSVPHTRFLPASAEVSEAKFRRFLRDFQTYERHLAFERTLDAFLDVYSSWRRTRDRRLKLRLVLLAFELHRLDERFECDLTFRDEPTCGKSS